MSISSSGHDRSDRHSYAGGMTDRTEQRVPLPTASRTADAVLAIAVAGVLSLMVALGQADAGTSASALPYVFAVGFGLVLLLRNRMPRTVLVLSVLGTFAYYTLDLPQIGVAVPVMAALLSAAQAGLLRWAVGAGVIVLVVAQAFRIRDGEEPTGFLLGYETVSNVALIAAAIALGHGLRATRLRAQQQAQLTALTQEQLTRDAELRVQRERERISRELHDTMGHTLSVIALHANVGREALAGGTPAAGDALERISAESTRSLSELRSMLRLLRTGGSDDGRQLLSLSGIGPLVERAASAGIEVTTDVALDPGALPAPVDAAAFSIVQESVTNVIRHSGAATAHVSASIEDDEVRISIADDGRGAVGAADGFGIVGMTERARLLGGRLATSSHPGEGFRVDAALPARLVA